MFLNWPVLGNMVGVVSLRTRHNRKRPLLVPVVAIFVHNMTPEEPYPSVFHRFDA